MNVRRISGFGCLVSILIFVFILSLIGRFTLSLLAFLLTNPIGWIVLVILGIYIWRSRPVVKVYRERNHSPRVQDLRTKQDDYVTLEDDSDYPDN